MPFQFNHVGGRPRARSISVVKQKKKGKEKYKKESNICKSKLNIRKCNRIHFTEYLQNRCRKNGPTFAKQLSTLRRNMRELDYFFSDSRPAVQPLADSVRIVRNVPSRAFVTYTIRKIAWLLWKIDVLVL